MPGYSGRKKIDDFKEYEADCERLNVILRKEYKRYYLERKEQGIVEKYKEKRVNVDSLIIEDFLKFGLSPEIVCLLIEFYIKYRPTYTPTILDNGTLSKETVEMLLEKRPDAIKQFNKKSIELYNIKEYVLANLDKFVFGDLPSSLASDQEVKELFDKKEQIYRYDGRDTEGYDETWINENGELKEWFKFSTGYKPKSKEDYMEVFYKYAGSDTTISNFCAKYHITSSEDFSNFLKRVGIENDKNNALIEAQSQRSRDRFWLGVIELSKKLANGEMTLGDFLKDNSSEYIHFEQVIGCIKSLGGIDYQEVKHNIAEQLYEYIINNEYSLNIGGLSKFFQAEYISTLKNSNSTELSKVIMNVLHRDGYMYNQERPMNEYYKAVNIVTRYNKKYNPKTDILFTSMDVNGVNIEVTQEHRDQMLAYLTINGLPKTINLAFHYLIEIVSGNINYSDELVNLREQTASDKKTLEEGIETCNGANDYLLLIDTLEKEKIKKELK